MPHCVFVNVGFVVLSTHRTSVVLPEPLRSTFMVEEVVGSLVARQLQHLVSRSKLVQAH